jgi:hypothetical protein
MATKFKPENAPDFKSVDRDIREHEWSKDDFDLSYTDSTCPFSAIIKEVQEPGMSYYFALNTSNRIDRLLARKWNVVDPSRLSNRQTFTLNRKSPELRDCITTGDTILLERDARYSKVEDEQHNKSSVSRIIDATKQILSTNMYDPLNPFSKM